MQAMRWSYQALHVSAGRTQILEEVIKFRWGALPDEQREGIRNYISNLIIKLSSDEVAFRRERVFLNKLNIILVQARPPSARSPICGPGEARLKDTILGTTVAGESSCLRFAVLPVTPRHDVSMLSRLHELLGTRQYYVACLHL